MSDYLYTCAELKAREVEFLDNAKLERMVDSKGTDGFSESPRKQYMGKI